MIQLTRLNGKEFFLNPELIESLEATPDTVIKLRGSSRCVVRETPEIVVERVLEYRRQIQRDAVEPSERLVPRARLRTMEHGR